MLLYARYSVTAELLLLCGTGRFQISSRLAVVYMLSSDMADPSVLCWAWSRELDRPESPRLLNVSTSACSSRFTDGRDAEYDYRRIEPLGTRGSLFPSCSYSNLASDGGKRRASWEGAIICIRTRRYSPEYLQQDFSGLFRIPRQGCSAAMIEKILNW